MSALPAWGTLVSSGLTPAQSYARACARYAPEQAACRRAAQYINTHLPDAAKALLEEADQYLRGYMVLCGTMGQPYFVGDPPRWSEDPVGDAEYVFMLNRMEHWPVLLHAYYLTGRRVYADKVVAELENWIDTCPPLEISLDFAVAKPRFSAATPWRSLELGVRANRSWNLVLQLLSGDASFGVSIYEKMMASLYQHAQILYQVCPVLWPKADHNHYLTECLGLLEISCLCDFMDEAPLWRAHALRELERCAQNQILPGGGQVEGAPTYHNECLFQMTYSIRLAHRYGFAFSVRYEELVHSMLLRSIYITRPDGNCVPWGDSDATPLVFRAAFSHFIAFREYSALELVGNAFGKEGLQREFTNQIWALPDAPALAGWLQEFCPVAPTLPCFLHDVPFKQVMFRTGWVAGADSVFFSARSPLHNDHAHIDPNAFEYYSHGAAILPDPGRFTYREGGDRHYYKSTESHSTLTVNGRDAFAYRGTWAYGPQREGGILAAAQRDGFSYACGWHSNYDPAIHRRALILTSDYLVVYDEVTGLAKEDLVNCYYLFDSTACALSPDGFSALTPNGRLLTTLSFCGVQGASILAGRVSETVDHERCARRLCLTAEGAETQRFLAVLCCRDAGAPIRAQALRILPDESGTIVAFTLAGTQRRYHIDRDGWTVTQME